MSRYYPGETRDGHTFLPYVFPDDGHGSARVMCVCNGRVIVVNVDALPTEEPDE